MFHIYRKNVIIPALLMILLLSACGKESENKISEGSVPEAVEMESTVEKDLVKESSVDVEVEVEGEIEVKTVTESKVTKEQESEQKLQLDDEELARIYSYHILEDAMFYDLEQAVTGKDCYDYALAYLKNYGEDAIEKFKHYIPKVPADVEVEATDVLATVYLAAFVSYEAWVYD